MMPGEEGGGVVSSSGPRAGCMAVIAAIVVIAGAMSAGIWHWYHRPAADPPLPPGTAKFEFAMDARWPACPKCAQWSLPVTLVVEGTGANARVVFLCPARHYFVVGAAEEIKP